MGKLIQKSIEGISGYVIFFDNVRMDQYVKNFSTSISIDGSIGNASIEMIYVPDFYRSEGESTSTSSSTVIDTEDGIEDMTNVKIFIKNMFNDKYVLVFDGNIRSCSLTRNPGGYGLSFSSQDYMTWLNRTIVPLAVPLPDQLSDGDRLKWKTYGIDLSLIPPLNQNKDISFKGQKIADYIENIKNKTLDINKIYSNTDTVSYWDHVTSRLSIMGDIKKELVHSNIVDFVVSSGATSVNSMYVAINDIAKNLMFEFYQDRDGVIRIKPPFWNETVLYDHIIDPLVILNYSEHKNWSQRYTRVITTGALEDYMENVNTFGDLTAKELLTPVASYNGEVFSDYTSGEITREKTYNKNGIDGWPWLSASQIPNPGEWGGFWNWREAGILPAHHHEGIDIPPYTSELPEGYIHHFGYPGTVHFENHAKYGMKAVVTILEGDFAGYQIIYRHLSQMFTSLEGTVVYDGDTIGVSGASGATTTIHLHLEVKSPSKVPIDPAGYLRVFKGAATFSDITNNLNTSVGSNDLLLPTQQEKKYGISVYDVSQPLIKVSTSHGVDSSSVLDALKKYSIFMHNLLNSAVEVANMQTIAMPWIRPGFNVWIDPAHIDKIFYVNSVSHVGSPEGGVYTTMSLSLGRSRKKCVGVNGSFGRVLGSGSRITDNIFINEIQEYPDDFGKVLKTSAEYTKIRNQCINFYTNNDDSIIKANKSAYFRTFYGKANYDSKVTSKIVTPKTVLKTKLSSYHFDSWPTMKKKSRGIYVTELQKVLSELGFYKESYFDTSFGDITHAAVVVFQAYYKLVQDGTVGADTKGKLKDLIEAKANVITVTDNTTSSSGTNRLTDNFFTQEYTINEIQAQLDILYAKAPKSVVDRANKLKRISIKAKSYISKHYVSDARQ